LKDEELKQLVERLVAIGSALSSERELDVLLERIVDEARRFTRADGGTLFVVEPEEDALRWAIVQNESMEIRFGGPSSEPLDPNVFQPIPLHEDGAPRLSHVATAVVHEREAVNIADVYDEHDEFDFQGPIQFDERTGYRTRSMLVVPLLHHTSGVVGVLQLINARDEAGRIVRFDETFEQLTASLASQAAVAVKNAQLFEALERQFMAFTRSIAMAIDEKSPYTAGHVRRVVDITMRIAAAIEDSDEGPYADVSFSRDDLKALRLAAWMHDVGKITTPEWVVDKATKLETLFDRIELVRTRYELLKARARIRNLEAQLDRLDAPEADDLDERLHHEIAELEREFAFIERANRGVERMADEDVERVRDIASKTYALDGKQEPRLTADEVHNLSIRRGTLTGEEIQIIRDHASVSYRMLTQLPFSGPLQRVPEIAAAHHEKLNGEGYPRGLTAEELSLEARILAVADIFEALTAPDRPYKDPTPLSRVRTILGFMVDDGELDRDLVTFAIDSGVFDAYAEAEIPAEQRDIVLRQSVQEP
jgi:HD-GYP domain-containing protein (c-di-GMP phosphodiesterase class II)